MVRIMILSIIEVLLDKSAAMVVAVIVVVVVVVLVLV